jgi:transposase-like protein
VPGGWWLKYSPEFRAQALERLKSCDSVSALARELKIPRKWLYLWRERARATEDTQTLEDREKERLRKRVAELEQLVGRQTAEIDFFQGALRRIEERRQSNTGTGGAASTSKSR